MTGKSINISPPYKKIHFEIENSKEKSCWYVVLHWAPKNTVTSIINHPMGYRLFVFDLNQWIYYDYYKIKHYMVTNGF